MFFRKITLSFLFSCTRVLEYLVIFFGVVAGTIYINFLTNFADFNYFSLFFIHVPVSWLCLINYSLLSICCVIFLFYRNLSLFLLIKSFLVLGVLFTGLTLFSGMFWGLPLWGLLFIFDARFILVVFLFFLYSSFLFLHYLCEQNKFSYSLLSWLILAGAVNVPLIKYSVEWWNTLHQVSSLTQLYGTVHYSIYVPLLVFLFLFSFLYILLGVLCYTTLLVKRYIYLYHQF